MAGGVVTGPLARGSGALLGGGGPGGGMGGMGGGGAPGGSLPGLGGAVPPDMMDILKKR